MPVILEEGRFNLFDLDSKFFPQFAPQGSPIASFGSRPPTGNPTAGKHSAILRHFAERQRLIFIPHVSGDNKPEDKWMDPVIIGFPESV